MEWPKLKNIIILLLLMTNAILLFFVGDRIFRDAALQAQLRRDAVGLLQDNGITMDEDLLPRKHTLSPLYTQRDLDQEARIAAGLLGEVEREESGGALYRYENENGYVQFPGDGRFSAYLNQGLLPIGDLTPAQHALKVLSGLGIQAQVDEEETDQSGSGSVTVSQLWQDVPLLSCTMTLRYWNGELRSITGTQLLVGSPAPVAGEVLSPTTALVDFLSGVNTLGDVCSRISGITLAYSLSTSLNGVTLLTPVWWVTTDTGTYQLNLLSGQLTRSS